MEPGDARPPADAANPTDPAPARVGAGTVIGVAVLALALIGVVLYFGQRAASDALDPSSASSSAGTDSGSGMSNAVPTPRPLSSAEIAARQQAERIAWASKVCRARDDIGQSLAALPGLALDDAWSAVTSPDQSREHLQAGLDQVTTDMASLGSAIGQAPIDYIEANDAIAAILERQQAFTAARDDAQQSIAAITGAGNPVQVVAALGASAEAIKRAYQAGVDVITTLDEVTSPTRGELREAFQAAPACDREQVTG